MFAANSVIGQVYGSVEHEEEAPARICQVECPENANQFASLELEQENEDEMLKKVETHENQNEASSSLNV